MHDWRTPAAWLAVLLVPLLLYLPTLGYGFIYDDIALVAENGQIRSLAGSLGYFGRDFDAYSRGWDGVQSNYYRPFVFVFMALVWPWAGDDPGRWHLIVVALNAIVGALAFAVLRRHRLSLARATFGSLLFSLHPLHVHSAAWITGLHDVLAAAFVLGAYLAVIRWLDLGAQESRGSDRLGLIVYGAGFAAALLTKESSISLGVFVLLLACHAAWRRPDMRRGPLALVAVSIATLALYLAWRVHVLGGLATPFPSAPPWSQAIASMAPLLWAYLGAWIWPVDLSLFSSFRPVATWASGAVALAWLGAAVLGATWLRLVTRHPRWLLPSLWFLVFLAPHFNLRVLNPEWALMHRYLYLASFGLAWGVAMLPFPRVGKWLATTTAVGILALAAVGSLHDMRAYADERTFWDKAVREDPASSAAWTEQGRLRVATGDVSGAAEALERAIALDPASMLPRLRLANLQFNAGRHAAAAAMYQDILRRSPDYAPAWRNLPSALLASGDREGALAAARETRVRLAGDPDAIAQLGVVFRLSGDLASAIEAFAHVVKLRPHDVEPRLRLTLLQFESGALGEARANLAEIRRQPLSAQLQAEVERLEARLRLP